eukprot:7097436-Prymnesium_polylepis.2
MLRHPSRSVPRLMLRHPSCSVPPPHAARPLMLCAASACASAAHAISRLCQSERSGAGDDHSRLDCGEPDLADPHLRPSPAPAPPLALADPPLRP